MTGRISSQPMKSWRKTVEVPPGNTNGKLSAKQKTKRTAAIKILILSDIFILHRDLSTADKAASSRHFQPSASLHVLFFCDGRNPEDGEFRGRP